MPLQIRRGTNAEREALIPSNGLVVGELLYVTDSQQVYIGTGNSGEHQGLAVTGYTNENAVDAIGAALVAGSHTSIAFTYGETQDTAGRIDAAVDLSNYAGTIRADAFKGSVFADDGSTIGGTLLVDAVDGVLRGELIGTVTGNTTGTHFGNVVGNVLGNVSGNLLGDSNGYHTGDVKGSVFGDNSSKIVDAVENKVYATFFGNLTGDIIDSNGDTVIDVAAKTSTFLSLNIEAGGSITSPALLISTPQTTFLNDTVSATDPFVNFFVASSAGVDTSSVALVRSRGTLTAPTSIAASDQIGSIVSSAFDGTSFVLAAEITSVVDGTVSTGVVPSRIDFSTSNATGTKAVKLSVKAAAVEFTAPPKLPVVADDTARTTLVPTPTTGMMIFMTSGTAPAATNKVQVYDSTAWVNLH